jgi:hypothetical protein
MTILLSFSIASIIEAYVIDDAPQMLLWQQKTYDKISSLGRYTMSIRFTYANVNSVRLNFATRLTKKADNIAAIKNNILTKTEHTQPAYTEHTKYRTEHKSTVA